MPAFVRETTATRRFLSPLLTALAAASVAVVAILVIGALDWIGPLAGPVHDGGWTNRSRGWFTSRGIHPTEFSDGAEGRYNWTGPSLRLQIAEIDRTREHRLTFEVEGARPAGEPRPTMSWLIDGATAGAHTMRSDAETITIVLPPRASTRAVVTAEVSPTFHAGPNDNRELGLVIRSIGLAPSTGGFRPTWSVVITLGMAVAAAVAGILLCGVPRGLQWPAAGGVAAAFTWLLLQDGAFLGPFVDALLHLGATAAGIGFVVALVRLKWSPRADAPDWAVAIGLVLAISIVKLAFFSHPLATIGDGIFQVHRAQQVQDGTYLFTSITPRPFFEFPYAIGLFIAASPFWEWFSTDVDHVWLLRTVALGADALVGVALFAVAWRVWRHGLTALLIAALWPFARAPFEALCNANLPNVFGQALFGVAMAGLVWSMGGTRRSLVVAAGTVAVLAAAFLSHFSTVSIGVPLLAAVAAVFAMARGTDWRRHAVWILAIGLAAATVSYAAYYRHFGEVYRATIERVMSHDAVDEPGSAIAASPAVKFRRWISGTSDDYGLPGAPLGIAAVFGLAFIVRERRRDPLTLVIVGWLAAWMIFTALGLLTAIQMRANLASAPVFVCLGAVGLAELGRRGTMTAALAVVLTMAVVVNGARLWFMCLGY